jgi:hypothetical protein
MIIQPKNANRKCGGSRSVLKKQFGIAIATPVQFLRELGM